RRLTVATALRRAEAARAAVAAPAAGTTEATGTAVATVTGGGRAQELIGRRNQAQRRDDGNQEAEDHCQDEACLVDVDGHEENASNCRHCAADERQDDTDCALRAQCDEHTASGPHQATQQPEDDVDPRVGRHPAEFRHHRDHQDGNGEPERRHHAAGDPGEDLAVVTTTGPAEPTGAAVTGLPHRLAVLALLTEALRLTEAALLLRRLAVLALLALLLAEATLLRGLAEATLLLRRLAETTLLLRRLLAETATLLTAARVVLSTRRRGVRNTALRLHARRHELRGLATRAGVLPALALLLDRLHHLGGVALAGRLRRGLAGLHHLGGLRRIPERGVLLLVRSARRAPLVFLLRVRWLGSTHVGSIPFENDK